ncbi:MAG: CHAT domain-containing protein [Steroidobacteraceae bacterium]
MSTPAGTLRLSPSQGACGWLAVLASCLLLTACGSKASSQNILLRTCRPVGGTVEASWDIAAPSAGVLDIRIEERGVSVIATLDHDPATAAASPVERFGTIVLVTGVRHADSHIVSIRAQDSPEIRGEACISAALVKPIERGLWAQRAFAAAGHATQRRDWNTAFDEYLSAARGFDRQRLRRASAEARHAMAELAYRRFDRKRDSYALAGQALADYGEQADPIFTAVDPIFTGLLAGLQGKALLDMPGGDVHVVAPRVRERLFVARKYDAASGAGARELPRLDIMTGFLEYMLDAPAKARELFAQAARSCRALQDWDCYAIASQNLALLAEADKNYAFALSAYGDALRALRPELDPKVAADIWNNLGRLQGVVGLFSSSAHSHAAAMREYAGLGDCPGVRRTLARSGSLLVQIGTLADAENDLQHAASLDCPELLASAGAALPAGTDSSASSGPPPTDRFSAPADTGHTQLCRHSLDARTLAAANRIVVFDALLSLGDLLMMEGDDARAQHCLDAAGPYAADSRTQVRLANARGTMLLERNDAEGAQTSFRRALRIADNAALPATYEHRGAAQLGVVKSALLAGNGARTLQDSTRALETSVARGDIDQTVTSLRLISAGYRASRLPAQAARTLQTAADLIEAVPIDQLDGEKRATYLATQYTVFAELMDLYASQAGADPDMTWLAFETSERGRARSLRYAITQTKRDASSPLEAPPAARYRQLLREVVQLANANAGAEHQDLLAELDSAVRRERGTVEPFDRNQLKQALGRLDATLVEYAAGSRDMFAFVIDGNGSAQLVQLGGRREIAAAAGELRELLRDPESPASTVRSAAERLARLALWPLTSRLSGKRIIFVPDDALHTIPFNVLPWSSNFAAQTVLQHAETSIMPSALFLTQGHTPSAGRASAPRIELIGDPVFRISDWHHECLDAAGESSAKPVTRAAFDWTEALPRLPGSRAEVLMVAQLARQSRPAGRVETLLGCAAVPGALRRAADEHVDLLHIATHARVDAQRPRLSALALTPEEGTGRPASAFGLLDILALKLHSSLVVLSACETSRGRLLPGEGVLGPAQAFLQAGAAAVIASYWRIDDRSTSSFMRQFYRYLLLDRLPASAALRRAQLDQATASSSYDWAAFALHGWPDTTL